MDVKAFGYLLELPVTPYGPVHDLQLAVVKARHAGCLSHDVVMMLEHASVFTLGRRGGDANLLVSEKFLSARAIDLLPIERGGDITYHGPGQLVVYVLADLKGLGMGVTDFVGRLEMAMVQTVAHWGVKAKGDKANRGVWVGRRKLGSVGITVRRGISFHGLALNISTDLQPFQWINPCGLEGCEMTSLEKEVKRAVEMAAVREVMARHLSKLFEMELAPIGMAELEAQLAAD